jgi:hypothetical protein
MATRSSTGTGKGTAQLVLIVGGLVAAGGVAAAVNHQTGTDERNGHEIIITALWPDQLALNRTIHVNVIVDGTVVVHNQTPRMRSTTIADPKTGKKWFAWQIHETSHSPHPKAHIDVSADTYIPVGCSLLVDGQPDDPSNPLGIISSIHIVNCDHPIPGHG